MISVMDFSSLIARLFLTSGRARNREFHQTHDMGERDVRNKKSLGR